MTRILPPDQTLIQAKDAADAELPARRTWIVLAVWAVTGALGLFRLSRAKQHLEGELGSRLNLASGPHWELLESLRRSARMDRRVRLTISPQLGSPIAIGQDEICFPERALTELKPEEMRSALAHELAHLAHRDPAWKGFAAGVSAVFFFQPLLRLARRRLDVTAEYLADDWAVRHSGNEVSLARCLATVAGWQTMRLNASTVSEMAGGASPLLKRVERLLGVRPSEPARIWCYAGAMLLVLGGWILAPGVTTRPRHVDSLIAERSSSPLVPMAEPTLLPEVPLPQAPPAARVQSSVGLRHPAPRIHSDAPEMAERMPLPDRDTAPNRDRLAPLLDREMGPEIADRMPLPEPGMAPDVAWRTPLPDRDTAPVARYVIIPHEALQARVEIIRAMTSAQNLSPEEMCALVAMEQRLFEMEMAARGIRVVWMEPPVVAPAPSPPHVHSQSNI